MALNDHLLNKKTYRQLSEKQAEGRIKAITKLIKNFTLKHLKPKETTSMFLNRSLQIGSGGFLLISWMVSQRILLLVSHISGFPHVRGFSSLISPISGFPPFQISPRRYT